MKIEQFERKVISWLCSEAVTNSTLHQTLNNPEKIECKFTGAGYYLDIYHQELPKDRIVCDKPNVIGNYQDIEVGFVAFIENGCLCLECFNYGKKGVPQSIRNGTVEVSTT